MHSLCMGIEELILVSLKTAIFLLVQKLVFFVQINRSWPKEQRIRGYNIPFDLLLYLGYVHNLILVYWDIENGGKTLIFSPIFWYLSQNHL